MSRDHRKLRVFVLADELVLEIYQATQRFPRSEQFGIQGQIRRAAVSAAANIVEGSARRTEAEYVHFLNVALGSASEARYLANLSQRLQFMTSEQSEPLEDGYDKVCAGLTALINSLGPQ
jgi:four helix bundle protein